MHRVARLGLVAGLLVASCTSDPEATIEVPEPLPTLIESDVEVSDTATATTSPGETTPPPQPTTSAATTTTTSSLPATTEPEATRDTGAPPPVPVDTEPIGDGPVLTDPSEGAPGGSPLAPAFFAFTATTTVSCNDAAIGTVSLQWEVIGTESISIAIGDESRIYRLAEPPAGSLDAPLDCTDGGVYIAIAENPEGRTVRRVTVAP